MIASSADDAVDASRIPPVVLDVDVQYSPLTNVMPIRRLGLDRAGATGSFVMAWVSVPSLTVSLDPQHYTLLGLDGGELCARFESGDGLFSGRHPLRRRRDGCRLSGDRSTPRLNRRPSQLRRIV